MSLFSKSGCLNLPCLLRRRLMKNIVSFFRPMHGDSERSPEPKRNLETEWHPDDLSRHSAAFRNGYLSALSDAGQDVIQVRMHQRHDQQS